MTSLSKIKRSPFFIRLFNWEYWPFNIVYIPVYIVWFWYSIRARSFFFFGASNPFIRNAGFLQESKKEIYELIPAGYTPPTFFFRAGSNPGELIKTIKQEKLSYPLIIKPDIGMQGKAVLKVTGETELLDAAAKFDVDYIIQPFIPYEKEIGIFYVRYPGEPAGRITGIVEKEFLTVTGDGVSTIEQLLQRTPRYVLQLPVIRKMLGNQIYTVPLAHEKKVLVPYGNHVRGSLFLDSTYKNNAQVSAVIDAVCSQVKEFYFGRLDIRFSSFEELAENKNWSIIELNGAGSEPTHMYDPRHSIWFAWKEIIRHIHMLFTISVANKKRGFAYLRFTDGMNMLRENKKYVRKLNSIQFYSKENTTSFFATGNTYPLHPQTLQ